MVLAALAATAYMLWTRHTERATAAAAGCIVLLVGLTLSFSQSSILALLAGLLALVVLRWGWRWALVAGVVIAIASGALVLAAGVKPTSSESLETRSSGRVSLITGGVELAGERPLYGYGSGAFQSEFAQRHLDVDEPEGARSRTASRSRWPRSRGPWGCCCTERSCSPVSWRCSARPR